MSRLLFAATNTPFEDVRYSLDFSTGKPVRPEFDAAKAAGAFPMGQVPVLVATVDGKKTSVCQSKTIGRYIASKTGLLGSTPEEAADIDSVCETVVDLLNASGAAKTDEEKAAFVADKLTNTLATLEGLIGSGYAVSGKLSQADVVRE